LIATRLSEELKVGETPIIFALQMLGQGGMVKKIPRRGYFVQNIDLRRVEHIYDLREYLEGASAALAAKNLTDAGRQALLSLYEQPMDRRMLVEADVQFHKILMDNSQNELLQQHLTELLESIRLFHIFGLRVIESRLHEVVAEHRAIISSVLNGESDLSETLMRAHIRRSKAHSLRELVEFGLATG
jgi:DNA-binding GntR family transcriptional regulator